MSTVAILSLLGTVVQCGIAWVVTLQLRMLRHGDRSGGYRTWSWAFVALALGLSAISLRFVGPLLIQRPAWWADGAPLAQACQSVYMAGKLAWIALLLVGAQRLARGGDDVAYRRLAALVGVVGAGLGAVIADINLLLALQALAIVPGSLLARRLLLAAHRHRPNEGCRIAATGFALLAILWSLYVVAAFAHDPDPAPPAHGNVWNWLLAFNSYFDLAVLVTLGGGLMVIPVLDAHRTADHLRAESDRLRERLLRDEKLAALASLVGGVAHELNNPLTAILGFAEELEGTAGCGSSARIVRQQAERCRAIVRSLLRMAGEWEAPRQEIAPERLLRELIAAGTDGIPCELHADADLPPVFADRAGLETACASLLRNAVQASPRGGRVRVLLRHDAGNVAIVFEDQGPGVPPELRARVFEPFFTTRDPGQGSGLGLAVAHGIARSHGGRLDCEAAPGGGARFVLRLPGVTAIGPVLEPVTPLPAPRHALHVLLVDDEPLVRQVLRRRLLDRGHRVSEAGSGEAARSLLVGPACDFAAIVCDLRMPGLDGRALHQAVQRSHPERARRFVFTTGDPGSPLATETGRSGQPVVGKPFDLPRLIGLIERIAEGVPAAG